MAEGSGSRGQSRSRPALGDVTNRIGKRGFSAREKDEGRGFDFSGKDTVKRVCVSPRSCSGLSKIPVENREANLKGGNDVIGSFKFNDGSEKGKILDLRGANVVNVSINELDVIDDDGSSNGCDGVAGLNCLDPDLENLEGEEGLNSVDGCSPLDSLKENKISGTADELGESSHADTSRTVSETGVDFLHDGEENISPEGAQGEHNHLDDHNADNFVLSQSGSVDFTALPQSQESRVFGIDKGKKVEEDECALMTGGSKAINACSCSFCSKAQYIWLDLHQKDIKARLSALKKSQKDASILAERSSRMKVNEKHGGDSSKLESHLMNQWRSLFQHMSDIWAAETNQLEASLLPLNNLKDKCKVEMELNNAKLPENH
ncbi:uncharacterized protein LOC125212825 [Salvia hispanica]|uniref:uncharacterized protein LOC125212825 n=1 Tax=Salvia hispanica TaxID=49212 RepID=UPI00200956A5|nr:uncharacterized protein LOC125212825 [Salvia hispanica]